MKGGDELANKTLFQSISLWQIPGLTENSSNLRFRLIIAWVFFKSCFLFFCQNSFLVKKLNNTNMSFFGGGQPVNTGPSPLTLAKIEAEVMTEMFNK